MKRRQLTRFGIEVKKAVIDRGMTLTELAGQVGTSQNYLWLIMHGDRPRSKYNRKIIQILDLPDGILDGESA